MMHGDKNEMMPAPNAMAYAPKLIVSICISVAPRRLTTGGLF